MAGARVLAVDDDERNLLAISEVLTGIAEIVCVQSGEEALRALLREEFAAILLDVLMPGLDGYETAALIRQRELSKRTPIIFLTAISKEDAHMLRGYDAGAVDYIFKPFDPVMLRSKVSVFVDLFEKTKQVQQKAIREQQLLEQALHAESEKLRAERSLRHAEERQAAILSTLPVCFHARTAAYPYAARYVSPGVERLTGFQPEKLTSVPDFGLSRVHPDDVDKLRKALDGAKASGSYACEFRWKHVDDKYRIFLDQGVFAPSREDGHAELHGTMLDITDRRHLEEQLLQAQRMDAIGKLTGGLAHDFNNLLATILSGLNLLERGGEFDAKAKKIVDMTRHSAKQGAELVTRMLTFSRRQTLKPEPLHLSRLGETINALVTPVLGGLIRFEWLVDDEVWPTLVDSSQLELALMNLVFNARDAMSGGGTISIDAENRSTTVSGNDLDPGDYVVISVSDTGHGIPGEIIEKVIEPFFTTKPVGKGTGLGLSTVYGFTRQSGGTLRIRSAPERGTTIELWLPRALDASIEVAPPTKFSDNRDTEITGGLPSVLLVDDSKALRELTGETLRQRGFDVTLAAGGAEALAALEREPDRFEVIVTDYAMPLVSGLDVIRFARSLRVGWPAVMITGYIGESALAALPPDVTLLAKPFSDGDLIDSICKAPRQKRHQLST